MGREKKQEYALLTAWGASFIATLGSLYFSEIMKFEPCVLCWYQRIFMYPFVLWLGIAVAKKDYRIASYSLPIASIGA
ncbi:disulfide oxidoreductase, partial [Bacillus thuringiensis]|nr:disulfide oxidoreductase [Bacillus thuringiensis]